MSDNDEWLTVAEAGKRLGISERQARRDVRLVSGADRRESGKGGLRVRLQALADVRGVAPPREEVRQESGAVSEDGRSMAEEGRRESGAEETGPPANTAQLLKDVTRLEDENRFMREQLAQAVSGWREEQRRTRQLEQRMKELAAPEAVKNEHAPGEAARSMEADGGAARDSEPGNGGTEKGAEGPKLGWWARLWGHGNR